jgi:hypothetical protein
MNPSNPPNIGTTAQPPAEGVTTEDRGRAESWPAGNAAARGDSAIPERIGKYRIVECLGRGGQGAVFRAVHPELGRDVVVKWAAGGLAPELHGRLVEEGRILARLDDPGLVRVFDVDSHAGRPFVVFEYVVGQSLAELRRRQRLSPRAAARLVAEIGRVVDYAHRQGVLHRDLKPANVLVDATGRPRVLDFGLAVLAHPWRGGNDADNTVAGTLAYMAPEQAWGLTDRVGPATDVFGLGGILYELLTGSPPHSGASAPALWQAARKCDVVPPRQRSPRVPRTLDRLCQQALARDPDLRFASADQFRRGLLGYLHRPRWIAAAVMTLVLLGVGLAFALTGTQGTSPHAEGELPASAEARPPASAPPTAPVKPAQPPAGWQVYHSKEGGYTVWLPGAPMESSSEVAGATRPRQIRQAILKDLLSGLHFQVNYSDFGDIIFPDAEAALDAARDGAVRKINASSLREERIKLGPHPGRDLRIALPGGKGLVVRARFFLVGQRNYQLLVAGPAKAAEGPAAIQFLESFRLDREY